MISPSMAKGEVVDAVDPAANALQQSAQICPLMGQVGIRPQERRQFGARALLVRAIEHEVRGDREGFHRQVDEAAIVAAQFRVAEETKLPTCVHSHNQFTSVRDLATAPYARNWRIALTRVGKIEAQFTNLYQRKVVLPRVRLNRRECGILVRR